MRRPMTKQRLSGFTGKPWATSLQEERGDTVYVRYSDGSWRLLDPRVRGKAAVKAAKRKRHA